MYLDIKLWFHISYRMQLVLCSIGFRLFHILLVRGHRDVAVILQLVTLLRLAGHIVGVLIGIVVGECHLAKLLLWGERLSTRLKMRLGRVLHSRSKMKANDVEDSID